jgi:hypothetical protein
MTEQKKRNAIKVIKETSGERAPTAEKFWKQKSLDELTEEQGIEPIVKLEQVLGKGSGLWDNDEDFELFLAGINERRKEEIQ